MIIWIDGPFGIGKSSVSNMLAEKIPDSRVIEFDEYMHKVKPENAMEVIFGKRYPEGKRYLIETFVKDVEHAIEDSLTETFIVPIALINDMCRAMVVEHFEKKTSTEHIILEATKENVLKRSKLQDGRDMDLVDTYFIEAKDYLDKNYDSAIRVDANERSIEDIAEEIIIKIHR